MLLKSAVVVIFLECISWTEGATLTTSTPNQCVYQSKVYKVGERTNTNPCSPCTCYSGGQVMCLAVECARPNCVNPVRKTGQCCQICPDGPNCKYQDKIIKSGEKYQADAHTTCQCSTGFMHIFGPHAHEAVCMHSAI